MRFLHSWVSVYFLTFLITLLSIIPFAAYPGVSSLHNLLHFIMYGVLAFSVLNVSLRKEMFYPAIFSFSYAFFLGLILEFIQFFLPYRAFQWQDVISNFAGSLVGVVLGIKILRHII
ncbi:MAG: VanZ family protein [Candidatus Omnitrophota bacterium]|nr:MAG: VanZ family protein [Candidatus Omnitrophota bacterium]